MVVEESSPKENAQSSQIKKEMTKEGWGYEALMNVRIQCKWKKELSNKNQLPSRSFVIEISCRIPKKP
jgi:hypothetical protein